MESVRLRLDQPTLYDEELHGANTLPSAEGLLIVTKQQSNGLVCVLLKFQVQLPDGKMVWAQYTTTGKLLDMFVQMAKVRHPYGNFSQ